MLDWVAEDTLMVKLERGKDQVFRVSGSEEWKLKKKLGKGPF